MKGELNSEENVDLSLTIGGMVEYIKLTIFHSPNILFPL